MTTYIARFEALKQKVKVLGTVIGIGTLVKKLGRKLALEPVTVVALAVFKQQHGIATKKALYGIFRPPCSYKTLVVSLNRWYGGALVMLRLLLAANRAHVHPVKHVDSTEVPVCRLKNAARHRTMQGLAAYGHTGQGTFFGLKLHLSADLQRQVLALKFTPGNTDDRSVVRKLAQGLTGVFVADAGYVSEQLGCEFFREAERFLLAAPRKNMKKLMTKFQGLLLKTRMLIEGSFRCLKLFYGLVTSLPRSIDGYFAHYAHSLLAYLLA